MYNADGNVQEMPVMRIVGGYSHLVVQEFILTESQYHLVKKVPEGERAGYSAYNRSLNLGMTMKSNVCVKGGSEDVVLYGDTEKSKAIRFPKECVSRVHKIRWCQRQHEDDGTFAPTKYKNKFRWMIELEIFCENVKRSEFFDTLGERNKKTILNELFPKDKFKRTNRKEVGLHKPMVGVKFVKRASECAYLQEPANRKWLPDDAVGAIGITRYDGLSGSWKVKVEVPEIGTMEFDPDELEEVSTAISKRAFSKHQIMRGPKPPLPTSRIHEHSTFKTCAADRTAARVRLKKEHEGKVGHADMRSNMVGVVRTCRFEWYSDGSGGWEALVEVPLIADTFYPLKCLDILEEGDRVALRGPSTKYDYFEARSVSCSGYRWDSDAKFSYHLDKGHKEAFTLSMCEAIHETYVRVASVSFEVRVLEPQRNRYLFPSSTIALQSSPKYWRSFCATVKKKAYVSLLQKSRLRIKDLTEWLVQYSGWKNKYRELDSAARALGYLRGIELLGIAPESREGGYAALFSQEHLRKQKTMPCRANHRNMDMWYTYCKEGLLSYETGSIGSVTVLSGKRSKKRRKTKSSPAPSVKKKIDAANIARAAYSKVMKEAYTAKEDEFCRLFNLMEMRDVGEEKKGGKTTKTRLGDAETTRGCPVCTKFRGSKYTKRLHKHLWTSGRYCNEDNHSLWRQNSIDAKNIRTFITDTGYFGYCSECKHHHTMCFNLENPCDCVVNQVAKELFPDGLEAYDLSSQKKNDAYALLDLMTQCERKHETLFGFTTEVTFDFQGPRAIMKITYRCRPAKDLSHRDMHRHSADLFNHTRNCDMYIPLYAALFPRRNFPHFWKSIRDVRAMDRRTNLCRMTDGGWHRFTDPFGISKPDDYDEESPPTRNICDAVTPFQQLSNAANTKVCVDVSARSEQRRHLMSNLNGLLRHTRDEGRQTAVQPPGFVPGTVMREYQKMSLHFLLELEKGRSSGAYEVVESSPGIFFRYYPSINYWMPLDTSSPPALGSRLGGFLCDEMGLGKTIVSLAVILSNPPPNSRLARLIQGNRSGDETRDADDESKNVESSSTVATTEAAKEDKSAAVTDGSTTTTKMSERDVEKKEKNAHESRLKSIAQVFEVDRDRIEACRDKEVATLKRRAKDVEAQLCSAAEAQKLATEDEEEKVEEHDEDDDDDDDTIEELARKRGIEMLDLALPGMAVSKKFTGYGKRAWRGVVSDRVESASSCQSKGVKYYVNWSEDDSHTSLTANACVKHAVAGSSAAEKRAFKKRIRDANTALYLLDPKKRSDGTVCVCGAKARDADATTSSWIACDSCARWFHFDCVGLTRKKAEKLTKWRCSYCDISVSQDGAASSTATTTTTTSSPKMTWLCVSKAVLTVSSRAAVEASRAAARAQIAVVEARKTLDTKRSERTFLSALRVASSSGSVHAKVQLPACMMPPSVWEMGKTHSSGRVQGGTLVVCALSLVGQWQEEAKKFCVDGVEILSYHGQGRKKDRNIISKYDIVITTYQTLGSDVFSKKTRKPKDRSRDAHKRLLSGLTKEAIKEAREGKGTSPLHGIAWHRVIVDESHYIKNTTANMSIATTSLYSNHALLVTGTPLNKRVDDFVGQMMCLDYDERVGKVLMNVERYSSAGRRGFPISVEHTIRKLMVRHEKDQTIDGEALLTLPPKTESTRVIEWPNSKSRKAYEVLEKRAAEMFERSLALGTVASSTIRLYGALMPMRLFCSLGVSTTAKTSSSSTSTTSSSSAPYYCPRCYGSVTTKMSLPCDHWLCESCFSSCVSRDFKCWTCNKVVRPDEIERIDIGAVQSSATNQSTVATTAAADATLFAKLKILMDEMRELREKDKTAKILIFSQFKATLEKLQCELTKAGLKYRTLTGSMSLAKRKKALSMFQNDPPTTVFLLSIRAGAVGINLTQANHVFLLDACTNPALEAQAIGRVWRLGQKRSVKIRRFVMKDSIETRIRDMVETSSSTASSSPAKSTSASAVVKEPGASGKTAADAIPIGLSSTGAAGAITSDYNRLRIAEFRCLFGIKDTGEENDAKKVSDGSAKKKKEKRGE
eukprot:g482.t1